MTSGILNIDKPRGVTSFSVVSRVRRLTSVRRVGHAGTLDPIADGVLPVCLGQATRVTEYIIEQTKVYRGTVRLGVTTDTYDSEGATTATGDASGVTEADVVAALLRFSGEIEQVPPMFSALKRRGRPLYEYARAGETVTLEPRPVTVHRIELVRYEPPSVELEIECGSGTYIRSIAHDLGAALGCGAHLEALTRLRSGPFHREEAVSLATFETAAERGEWETLLLAIDRALEAWPAAILGEENGRRASQGRELSFGSAGGASSSEGRCRAYSVDGDFVAVLRDVGDGRWKPQKVLAAL